MRILITGGAGYMGSRLVPALLADGHEVVVYDTFWFGDRISLGAVMENRSNCAFNNGLICDKADIREIGEFRHALKYWGLVDAVIHLACLSNDPSSEIDKDLTKTINLDAFEPLVVAAKEAGVRRFIYCSTSSVYGVSDAPDVREDHPHVPITLYNTYKSQCEPLLMKHASPDFECVILRPSTHCGYSPRQRLDLAVNILTNLAYNKGVITVYGGDQKRPNIHIDDMVDCYRLMLTAPAEKVVGEVFNVGAGNVTIMDLALLVRETVGHLTGRSVEIEVKGSLDPRSYSVNSDKIESVLGFRPRRTITTAVSELCGAFAAGKIPDPLGNSVYYNVKRMREVFSEIYKNAPPSQFDPSEGHLSEIDSVHRLGRG